MRGGVPDGMRVDVKGNVFVTGPGGIWVWDPDGNHLGTVMMPESAANLNREKQTIAPSTSRPKRRFTVSKRRHAVLFQVGSNTKTVGEQL